MLNPRVTSLASFACIAILAATLLIREGMHRGAQRDDVQRLKEARSEVDSLQRELAVITAKVDTVRVVVRETRQVVDTVVQRIEVAQAERLQDARTATRLRRVADSLIQSVDPAVIIQRGPLVRAAYAYRMEADTLRAQKARVDATLDTTKDDLLRVNANMVRIQLTLQDAYSSLGEREDDIARLRADLRSLQGARECRILGLITCPSRNATGLAGVALGAVGVLVLR